MNKAKSKLTPVRLKIILIIAMITMLSLGVGGFYLAFTMLTDRAASVSQKVAEAEASEDSVTELQQLETRLKELEETRRRTESITAGISSYQYQDQVIRDLNRYASQAGLRISQFTFEDVATASTATPGRTGGGAPAPSTSTTAGPPAANTPASSAGLKTATVNISLEQPVSYLNLLRFVKSIENNLTKMQLSGLALSPGENRDLVSTDSLTIEVYIK